MTDNPVEGKPSEGFIRALLAPLRTPQRVVGNIETIATALLALHRDTHERLATIDDRLAAVLRPLNRLDRKVTELNTIEQAVTEQTEAIREELNKRMLAVEAEVRGMRAPIERMARDLGTVVELLPNPSDGPLARLKDTLTSS
jgi:chromosome segregation ATPase